MSKASFALHYSRICGGAGLIGTLDCFYIKIEKVPIHINFEVVCDVIKSFFRPTWRRLINHLKFEVFANSAFEFNTLSLKRYKFYLCFDMVVTSYNTHSET